MLSFHWRSGSSMRAWNRRPCSSLPTSSQYFRRMMPLSSSIRSNSGTTSRNRSRWAGVQKPSTYSTPARLYQLRSKTTTSPAAGRCGHVPLGIHLRLLAVGWSGERDHPEDARADPFGEGPDGPALPRSVATLEYHHHLQSFLFHPFLQLAELDLQPEQLLPVFLPAEFLVRHVPIQPHAWAASHTTYGQRAGGPRALTVSSEVLAMARNNDSHAPPSWVTRTELLLELVRVDTAYGDLYRHRARRDRRSRVLGPPTSRR